MTKITAAEAMLKVLGMNGVEVVFGYPGAAAAPIYQALKKSPITHILARSEQGAAHMAAAQFKASGKTGVCLSTSGPGATNLVTAIAAAYMDSVPLVAITAQVAVSRIGSDAFQEVDTTGITAPITKNNYLVKTPEDLPRVIQEAFYLAETGRPGPVLVDVPYDVLKTKIEWVAPETSEVQGYRVRQDMDIIGVSRLSDAIRKAKKPLLVIGGGVLSAGAQDVLADFLKQTGMPAVCTMMGLSALPDGFLGFLGMTGVHGMAAANSAVQQADLVIFAGSRITERSIPDPQALSAQAKTAHIDIDPAELSKNCDADICICADVKSVLMLLTDALKQYRASWSGAEIVPAETGSREGYADPKEVLAALRKELKNPVIITTEVGAHQIWAARHFAFKKDDVLLTSGGLGAMGYGLPAAIGAAVTSEKTVVAISGDGSFQMSMPELATMVETGAKVKMILFNNRCLGMVREVDKVSPKAQHVHLSAVPDFCKLAAAYGIPAERVNSNDAISSAIRKMLDSDGAYLLEINTDPKAHA